jgi:hypothetical protein
MVIIIAGAGNASTPPPLYIHATKDHTQKNMYRYYPLPLSL